ncbi:MAG: amino acid-binding protein [Saccharofermentans sp.]|nr:amino acid-binding protein [Saccharofermentans sp.]
MLKQLSIFAENKRGAMNGITKVLKDNEIDIVTLVTNDSAEFGIVRLIVDNPEKAHSVMKDAGYLCRLDLVTAVEMKDEYGSLNNILDSITNAYLNIDYIYISFNRETAVPVAIMKSNDEDDLDSYLLGKGYIVL